MSDNSVTLALHAYDDASSVTSERQMNEPSGQYGAVLVIRIWFESHPSPSTLRARILQANDPSHKSIDSVAVVGVQQTADVVENWLSSYVRACERHALTAHDLSPG
jgi:hypothetical protein